MPQHDMIGDVIGQPVPGLAAALAAGDTPSRQGLVALPWFPFEVLASAGCRRTAGRIARRAERAYWILRRTLDVAPRIRLLVLDRSDWASHAEREAFGVMHQTSGGDLVVGAEPAEAWSHLSEWLRESLDAAGAGCAGAPAGPGPAHATGPRSARSPSRSSPTSSRICSPPARACASRAAGSTRRLPTTR